jgi:GNAT superfamily N-acetyltransferase
MDITCRTASAADAPALADLGRRSFTETFGHRYDPADLAAFLQNHSEAKWSAELCDPAFAVRIAEEGGEPVGFAKLGPRSLPVEPGGPAIELRQLYVLQPWHGRGVAQELMRWVLSEARARGAQELYLSVFVENSRARRFYERLGFIYVGRYAFMVGSHEDEDLIMRLQLS